MENRVILNSSIELVKVRNCTYGDEFHVGGRGFRWVYYTKSNLDARESSDTFSGFSSPLYTLPKSGSSAYASACRSARGLISTARSWGM